MIRPPQHIAISLILVLAYFTLAGCNTTNPNINLAEELVQQGQWMLPWAPTDKPSKKTLLMMK